MGNKQSRARKDSPRQAYPTRPASAPLYPAEPPPPYTPTAQPPYQSMAYGVHHYHPGSAPAPRPYPVQTVVQPVIHAHFDAGTRFDARCRPNIPPPPPGVYPNAAQIALANGHQVILEQKKTSFLGDRGAGYTFW